MTRLQGFVCLVALLSAAGAVACSSDAEQAPQPEPAERLVFVGSYTGETSRGIQAFRFNESSGILTSVGLAAETPSPSFLTASADGRFVFAVNEVSSFGDAQTGSVTSFSVDPTTGQLTQLSVQSSHGQSPCHLALDRTGRFLAVANYSSGTFAVLPVDANGHLGPALAVIQSTGSGPHPSRQRGPHAHMVQFDASNRFLLGSDLGIDRVLVYRFDEATGSVTPNEPPSFAVTPGAGPRHFAFHPTEPLVFVINELSSTISVFEWDGANGHAEAKGEYPTLPDDFSGTSTTAQILVHPNGRFVYGSNRGHDSIATFTLSSDGQLALVEHTPTRGGIPRNFAIDPSGRWLIAANQRSNTLAVFAIDPQTGRLTETGPLVDTGTPVAVLFMP